MDLRRVISFGKSSFVVSIPKSWARLNNIVKGDVLRVEEQEDSLLFSRHTQEKKKNEERTTTIDVSGKSIAQIKREIIPAYINNHKTIYIEGKELNKKAEEIQKILHNLMALEVISIENNRIVAKDFLNMAEISLNNLVLKMDKITRSMLNDLSPLMDKSAYENVLSRDSDVNRLTYLTYRAIRFGAQNPSSCAALFDMNMMDLFNIWSLTSCVEQIADETKRIARYISQIKPSKEIQKKINTILDKLSQNYQDMMVAYHEKDKSKAHKVTARKEEVIKLINALCDKWQKIKLITLLCERMKTLAIKTHNIGRAVYE